MIDDNDDLGDIGSMLVVIAENDLSTELNVSWAGSSSSSSSCCSSATSVSLTLYMNPAPGNTTATDIRT